MYDDIKQKFKELEDQLMDPIILGDAKKLKDISKKHSDSKHLIALILELEKAEKTVKDNEEMINREKNSELLAMAENENSSLREKIDELKKKINEELHPADPRDKKDVIMEIRGGAGGEESALFAGDLFRMYARYAEKKGWKVSILDSSQTGIGGFKEVIFSVRGEKIYGHLKYEAGTHRVQRVPETEKAGRVHTSTATVIVLPEAEEIELEIKAQDLKIDTYCSSGPGGQNVNKVETAVRITHLPTGTVVACQEMKSQQQNRERAMQLLRSRILAKIEEKKHKEDADNRKKQIGGGDRSDKIRTYNFPQDRLTDHRINKSWSNLSIIMEGDLDNIVASLKQADK